MIIRDLFKLSTRMFKARTMRTFLTVLGMSIGIGAILFLVSLGYGLQKALLERITTSESLLTLDVAEPESDLVQIDEQTITDIGSIEGVEEVSPAVQITAQGIMDSLAADLITVGIRPSFLRYGGIKIEQGEGLNDNDPQGVVISSTIAQVYGKEVNEMLGKEIQFVFFTESQEDSSGKLLQKGVNKIEMNEKFVIKGIVEADENTVYINSKALERFNFDNYTQLKVKCVASQYMDNIRDRVLEKGLIVSSLSDTVDQANQVFGIIQIILMLFGVIALIVSAIGMFNTMTIALLERTEEIGIMKSIGASDTMVSLMFIMESSIMGFLGGLGGVIIGLLGGELFNGLINLVASRFGGQSVDIFHSPMWFVIMIVLFATCVGFITGFIPARRASKVDPLDALRYK